MVADSLCGPVVSSRRGLLAFMWSIVNLLTFVSFIVALVFTLSAKDANYYDYDQNYNNNGEGEEEEEDQKEEEEYDIEVAVTTRAMAFAALWTAVLASLMAIFGTVILGWQSPTGQYYSCCAPNVHKTTPLGLGSFIGALIMLANMTLVCSVLFGEFEIRDYPRDNQNNNNNNGGEGDEQQQQGNDNYNQAADTAMARSSMAFSILCIFLTVIYAGFAALTFAFARSVLEENDADELMMMNHNRGGPSGQISSSGHPLGGAGYIGERFDVRSSAGAASHHHHHARHHSGFVAPRPDDPTLT